MYSKDSKFDMRKYLAENKITVNERVNKQRSSVDGYKIDASFHEGKQLLNLKVETPDGYPSAIERISPEVAKEIVKVINKLI